MYDKVLTPFLMAVMFILYAVLEWIWHFSPKRPHPAFYTVVAIILVGYAAVQVWRTWPRIKALRMAIEGEKVVGQFLERSRVDGYEVFHDLIGSEFNVDHVLIGPAGIFTIETKTYSKPIGRDAKVACIGEKILVDGHVPDRNPLIQAKAQAGWLRTLLKDSTGKDFSVRPVVVFPYWFVEQSRESRKDVWVLEPKMLPGFVSHEPRILSNDDIKLASFHLRRFILAVEKERDPRPSAQ